MPAVIVIGTVKIIINGLKELDIGVIICPSAAISMTQHSEFLSPIHNSIAPINVFLEENVNYNTHVIQRILASSTAAGEHRVLRGQNDQRPK